jgi:hypothetical protein
MIRRVSSCDGTSFAMSYIREALSSLAATPILALKRVLVKPDVPAATLRGVVVLL